MPDTYSPNLRLDYQAPGSNVNTWGILLQTGAFQLLEDALTGIVSISTYPATLLTANGATDQARCMMLVCTGAGGVVTAPSVKKLYLVDASAATGPVTITTGSSTNAVVEAGNRAWVASADGSGFALIRDTAVLAQLAAGDATTLASAKTYTDNKMVSGAALPGSSTPRSFVFTDTNGNAIWRVPTPVDVPALDSVYLDTSDQWFEEG